MRFIWGVGIIVGSEEDFQNEELIFHPKYTFSTCISTNYNNKLTTNMLLQRSIVHFCKLPCTLHPLHTHQVFVEKNYMYMLLVTGNMIPEALNYKLYSGIETHSKTVTPTTISYTFIRLCKWTSV